MSLESILKSKNVNILRIIEIVVYKFERVKIVFVYVVIFYISGNSICIVDNGNMDLAVLIDRPTSDYKRMPIFLLVVRVGANNVTRH